MKKFTCLLFFSFICLFVFAAQASAFLCVNDDFDPGFDFQAKLDSVSPSNNEVRLKQGTYDIADSATGHFKIVTSHSLTISGGWNDDCTSQTEDPELTILQGGITQNESGGVLSVIIKNNVSPETVSISNLKFQNGSTDIEGGGLSIQHTFDEQKTEPLALATVNITNIIAESNVAEVYGSGIAFFEWSEDEGMNISITDSIVKNNYVPPGSLGGPAGIYIDTLEGTNIDVNIIGCQILNNIAEFTGGGLYIDPGHGNTTLVNNVIAGNKADDFGGGIYLSNVLFGSAGGSYTLTNNTITGNSNTGVSEDYLDGGGIYVEYDDLASIVNIYNNIIYGNTAPGDGADLYIYNINGQTNLFNNDFNTSVPAGLYIESQINYSDGNNVNVDPLFACTESDNYHLTSTSPVRDLGSNTAPSVPTEDLDGLPRPFNSIVDMGAYEFQNTRPILPGDINDDGEVTLQDALLGAQILAGITPDAPICKNSDINDVGILGGDDILFILQKISGLEK